MAYLDDIDQRQVKRGKFGPLDVYPQEERQREDELSGEFVKNGFKYAMPELLKESEYQGAKEAFLASASLEADIYKNLMAIVMKREEANTFNDAVKKQNLKQTNPFKSSPILVRFLRRFSFFCFVRCFLF
jgi:hypothetical protein